MKKKLSTLLITALIASCNSTQHNINASAPQQINNIIMVVADGMGPAYTTAYRYFADNPETPEIEKTVFDRHYVGSSSTYPAPVSGYITDSAAAATALATGVKTYNDAISVDVKGKPLTTVLEKAKSIGMKTGVVVTSQINHATPASYLSHNAFRRNYNEIADSYIDNGIKADIYLGGGWQYFIRQDRNLVNEFKENGFHYVDNYQSLMAAPQDKPLLGLFGKQGLDWALDDDNKHRLSMMTKLALPRLENKKGYFMLIEASQVDWAGHGNDIASAMHEMDDLAKTMEYLESYVADNPDTLVILTADHSTGGLSIGRKTGYTNKKINSKYLWQPEIIREIAISPQTFGKTYSAKELTIESMNSSLNFELTQAEYQQLVLAKKHAISVVNDFANTPKEQRKEKYPPRVDWLITNALKSIIDVRTNTGWGGISDSATHTGVDVPVFAIGSEKHRFSGAIDNTDIAKEIFTLLKQ